MLSKSTHNIKLSHSVSQIGAVLVSITLLTMTISSFAWSNTSSSVTQSNAKDVVSIDSKAELQSKLRNISSFQAAFTQQVSDSDGELVQALEGQITIGKPNKMRWLVESPDESLLIADGTAVYNIDYFVEQVTIIEQASLVGINPLALLLEDQSSTWNDVNVTYSGENAYKVTSQDTEANVTGVVLTFNDDKLIELKAFDKQGQTNQINFESIKLNPMLELNLFTADIPDGFTVDDQR